MIGLGMEPYRDLLDSRAIPLGVVSLSVVFHIISAIYSRASVRSVPQAAKAEQINSHTPSPNHNYARRETYIHKYGGTTIFGFMVARLVGSFVLLCLSVQTFRQGEANEGRLHLAHILALDCTECYMTVSLLYTTILSNISLSTSTWGRSANLDANAILFSTLAVYSYRDLWPLATYRQTPIDLAEGKVLWFKMAILTVIAIIIPLCIPRRYVPVDPKNPMPMPNPAQTASWLSRLTFLYVDPIIWLGYKVRHLRHDQLPPLSDDDYSEYQTKKAFQLLDPLNEGKHRHIFFGLIQYFRREYIIQALMIIVGALCSFAAPLSLNKILRYLETNGENASIRPWFWIALFLLGPILDSIAIHWFLFLGCRTRVRLEGLITQLVFEHSLRARLKADTSTKEPDPNSSAQKSKSESTNQIGKIHNLVTSDLSNIVGGIDFLFFVIQIPLKIALSIGFLYQILGWSAIVGLCTTIVFIPVPGFIGKKVKDIQTLKMKRTDARVQTTSEAVNVMRMIKLFGWERKMSERVRERRDEELQWMWKIMILKFFNGAVGMIIPTLTMLSTYATYTVIMKGELNASKIFSTITVFDILRTQIQRISWRVTFIVQAKVSLDRLDDFLKHTELLDSFTTPDAQTANSLENDVDVVEDDRIGFADTAFSWALDDEDGSSTPSSRQFKLRIDGELAFKRNCINLIVGPTGSGKTSLLMALLGEMHYLPLTLNSWSNLPRKGGVAYAAQESWVQNATIKDNILFGAPYNPERYKKVIRQCALEQDLSLFEAGDDTEVGERGLTLSGGQKARLTLARAIYSQAEIILLDDILASLDVHTSKWIVDKCFRGDLVEGRTILLVTHNVALTAPMADFIVSIGLDGRVQSQGTDIKIALACDPVLASEVEQENLKLQTEGSSEDVHHPSQNASTSGKLVIAEEIVQGHITLKSLKLFLAALGGNHPSVFFTLWILAVTTSRSVAIGRVWFLGVWGSQYESRLPSDVNLQFYLTGFTSILFIGILISTVTDVYYNLRVMKAARTIHLKLIDSVFGATLRWLDETPTGRIIARCTQDMRSVDGPIPQSLAEAANESITVLTKLGAIVLFTPIFMIPGSLVAILGMSLGSMYLRSQLSVKREMSNARSPVLAHFNAAVHGLISVRAYGAQRAFKEESHKRINFYSRAARISWDFNRWIGLRIDILGTSFTAVLASYLVYGRSVSAANSGLSLNMALEFCSYLFYLIRTLNDLEVECNSLERIQGYLDIDHEPRPTHSGRPPAAWPTSGDLRVENLSARYSQSGPEILHNLSFHIKSGQRIGIVGRTGSGKSSLTLALLRCIITKGSVYYDGIETNAINLDALRSSITIIPQTPELFSGTLRQNLDPFGQHDDATLNDALQSAGFFSLQQESDDRRVTLDTNIAGAGSNFSVGERQIVALARAIVRHSKLLILDEATSAIDYKTDALVQATLRQQATSDVTVITVAHRLQTIMDADKIMVLDNGRVVEFDSPAHLLQKDNGVFKAMVDGSADKAALYTVLKV